MIVSSGALNVSGAVVIVPSLRFQVAPGSTTYVYVDLTLGIISSNTTGFATGGIYPVAIVVSNQTEVTTLIDARPDVFGGGSGGSATPDSTQNISTSGTIGFLSALNTLVAATAGVSGITLTLPSASLISGQKVTVKMVDTGVGGVLINTSGGQTIDGQNSYLLSNQYQYATFQAISSNWLVVSAN